MPRTYQIVTFGCQMNAYDSEAMAGVLQARGLVPVESPEAVTGAPQAQGANPGASFVGAPGDGHADVVLLNTCIVRASAEQRALGRIDALKALRAGRPDRILGVCGCLAQRDAEALLERAPHLDLVLGTRAIPRLGELLDRIERGEGPIACVEDFDELYATGAQPVRRSALRALVTIMQGCDNWCTYCIVPSVRGRERSRPVEAILEEVRGLVAAGCREVTLVGQNVNAWRGAAGSAVAGSAGALTGDARSGKFGSTDVPSDEGASRHFAGEGGLGQTKWHNPPDCVDAQSGGLRHSRLHPQNGETPPSDDAFRVVQSSGIPRTAAEDSPVRAPALPAVAIPAVAIPTAALPAATLPAPQDFADLLGRVAAVPGLWRIRYITSHPRDAGPRQIDAVARLAPQVCDHFHLPVQAGSNAVLERMNRGYTREHYLGLVQSIRERLPDAAITTDLIVGFPGETEADFAQTLDLVERVRFDAAFTFFYNVRTGTRAAEWPDDVPLIVKKKRLARLIRMQEAISLEKNRALVGREVEVLVEGLAARNREAHGNLLGRTRGDKCVVFAGAESLVGQLVLVRIVEAAGHTLLGQRV